MWIPNRMMMSLKLEVEDKTLNVVVLVRAFCPFFFCVVYIRVIYYFFLFLFWRTVKFSKSLFFFFVCVQVYIYILYKIYCSVYLISLLGQLLLLSAICTFWIPFIFFLFSHLYPQASNYYFFFCKLFFGLYYTIVLFIIFIMRVLFSF